MSFNRRVPHIGEPMLGESYAVEPSPEVQISMLLVDVARDAWAKCYGRVVSPDVAIRFAANPMWADFLMHKDGANARDTMARVEPAPKRTRGMDELYEYEEPELSDEDWRRLFYGPPEVQEPDAIQLPLFRPIFGEIGTLTVRGDTDRVARSHPDIIQSAADPRLAEDLASQVHSWWYYHTRQYYFPVADNAHTRGYFVGYSPEADPSSYHRFFFAASGELRTYARLVDYNCGVGKPVQLRTQVHFYRGQVTSLWMDFPNGGLFEPTTAVPWFVAETLRHHRDIRSRSAYETARRIEMQLLIAGNGDGRGYFSHGMLQAAEARALARAQANLFPATTTPEEDIEEFIALVTAHQPIYLPMRDKPLKLEPHRKSYVLARLADIQDRLQWRSVQSLYYSVYHKVPGCEVGYRRQFESSGNRGERSIPTHYPFWAPGVPDLHGTITMLASQTVRWHSTAEVEDFLRQYFSAR